MGIFRKAKDLVAWASKKGMELKSTGFNAQAVHCEDDKGIEWFAAFIPKDCKLETICHECLHLGWFILESYGIDVTVHNHEAWPICNSIWPDKSWVINEN